MCGRKSAWSAFQCMNPFPGLGSPGREGWREPALSRNPPDLSRWHSKEGCARPPHPVGCYVTTNRTPCSLGSFPAGLWGSERRCDSCRLSPNRHLRELGRGARLMWPAPASAHITPPRTCTRTCPLALPPCWASVRGLSQSAVPGQVPPASWALSTWCPPLSLDERVPARRSTAEGGRREPSFPAPPPVAPESLGTRPAGSHPLLALALPTDREQDLPQLPPLSPHQ